MAWVICTLRAKHCPVVGADVSITNDPKVVAAADKIVFPGVGAMRDCIAGMHEAGIDDVDTPCGI